MATQGGLLRTRLRAGDMKRVCWHKSDGSNGEHVLRALTPDFKTTKEDETWNTASCAPARTPAPHDGGDGSGGETQPSRDRVLTRRGKEDYGHHPGNRQPAVHQRRASWHRRQAFTRREWLLLLLDGDPQRIEAAGYTVMPERCGQLVEAELAATPAEP